MSAESKCKKKNTYSWAKKQKKKHNDIPKSKKGKHNDIPHTCNPQVFVCVCVCVCVCAYVCVCVVRVCTEGKKMLIGDLQAQTGDLNLEDGLVPIELGYLRQRLLVP